MRGDDPLCDAPAVAAAEKDDGGLVQTAVTLGHIPAGKSAEDRLLRLQALQRVTGRMARVCGWSVEVPGMEPFWSEELREILPGSADVTSLEEGFALVSPPHQERLAAAFHACAIEGTPYDLEFPMLGLEGGELWTRVVAEAQWGEDGAIARVIGALQDITDLRRVIEASREAAEQLTKMLESMTDGFCAVDHDWHITCANRRAEEILGRSGTALLGRSFLEEFPVLDTELESACLRAMHRGSTEVIEEHYAASLDAWFDVRAFPSTGGLGVVFQDVTERCLARRALREREERLAEQAALLDEASDAIIVRDLGHRITYWNRRAEIMYGWTAEEAVGQSIRELLLPDSSVHDEAFARLLADGEWNGELTAVTRRGTELTAECRETLLRDDAGRPCSVLAIRTDITERKRLDAQHWRAERMQSIGTLAGGLAHDLNHVLAPVKMAIEVLQSEETQPSRLGMLEAIAAGTQLATDMVQQISSFAAGAEGHRRVEIDALLRDVERFVDGTFSKTIRIVREEATGLSPVMGDRAQLNHVLINLCVNAGEAMPDGGTLVLAADVVVVVVAKEAPPGEPTPGRYVRIRVEDDGEGMAPEVLERIFEPFYTTKGLGHGTGLGLSTSAGIVSRHGGFVRVDSALGRGTRFLVHLPAAPDAASPTPEGAPVASPSGDEQPVGPALP